jgi:precorrin-2 dehydrogenase / sirohydrochlorin ferrochelatase
MTTANLFPIFLKLDGKRCLVVGAGPVGESKIRGLLETGARVQVIAPAVTDQVHDWSELGVVELQKRHFQTSDLDGVFLVVAATSSPVINDLIFSEAQRLNILCNVVDVPDRCDFYYPALVRRGKLQIAISTSGESPTLAQRVKQELEIQFPSEYASWLHKIGRERRELLASEKSPERRLQRLRELSSDQSFVRYLKRTSKTQAKEHA